MSPFKHPFWSAYRGIGPSSRTLDEWQIIAVSYVIRSKDNWIDKYTDPEIKEKWQREVRGQIETQFPDEIIDYVWKELEWYAELHKKGIYPTFNEMIVTNILKEPKERLKAQSNELKASFDSLDYHPNSNNTVVDLVHPSLFPLQYGRTVVTRNEPMIVDFSEDVVVKKAVEAFGISRTYQWIPALLSNKNGRFSFCSYINNLDPVKFKDLYATIEDVFNSALPDLNHVLTRYASSEYVRVPIDHYNAAYKEGLEDELEKLDDWLDECLDNGTDYTSYDDDMINLRKKYVKSYPPQFKTPPIDVPIDLGQHKNLKVIVKMANIELTPENPQYTGGTWHVEGTINEDIVATVLYYYDVSNITESRISFRAMYEDPKYDNGDEFYCEHFYGIKGEVPMSKNLGSLTAVEDRIVVFPNFFQHKVEPFELEDKTRPGHRKILCFFVVDPYNDKVYSSKEVPPQQKSWWENKVIESVLPDEKLREAVHKLAQLQSLDEAKVVRKKLMEERVSAVEGLDDWDMASYERKFSLCEH